MKNSLLEVKLEDICQIIAGQSPPSSTYNYQGEGLPFFQGKADFNEIYPNVRVWCEKPEKNMTDKGEIVIYTSPEGLTQIDVKLEKETLWLTHAQIVKLFDLSKANISEHIKNIYANGELEKKATVRKFRTVKNHSFVDGNKRIAAVLFLHFLNKNRGLYRPDGTTLFDGNTLASITLMIAESKSDEMEIVKRIIISVLNRSKKL